MNHQIDNSMNWHNRSSIGKMYKKIKTHKLQPYILDQNKVAVSHTPIR